MAEALLLSTSAAKEDPSNGSLIEVPIAIYYEDTTNNLTRVVANNSSGGPRTIYVKDRDGLVIRALTVPRGTVTAGTTQLNNAGFVTVADASGVLFELA